MKSWLIDTNVISELRRPQPDENVVSFFNDQQIERLHVSTMTLVEIRFGLQMEPDPLRQQELDHWLTHTVRPMFNGRVLQLTEDVMLRWRLLVERGRKAGRTFSQPDLMIAATALEHGLSLVTRNVKDFTGLDLTIVNPWEAQPTPGPTLAKPL